MSLWFWWRKKEKIEKLKIDSLHWTEWVYLAAILVIIGIQVYRGFMYDLTYMSLDDAMYITYSADAFSEYGLVTVECT